MKNESEKVGEIVTIFCRGTRWWATFQQDSRQHRRALKTASKKEARRRALALEREILAGDYKQVKRAPSLSSAIEEYESYLVSERRAPRTLAKYKHCFRLVTDLAERRKVHLISGITLRIVDAFRLERVENGAQPKTVACDEVIIKQLVKFCVERGMLSTDPLAGLKVKKPKPRPQPCWTRQEVKSILDIAKSPHREALTILAETGMRAGELKFLTWDDVHLAEGRAVVLVRPKQGWSPKNGHERAIPLSSTARSVFESLPRTGQWVFTASTTKRHPQPQRQLSERRLLEHLKRILKKLGLQGHLHTLRHAFVSHALTEGIAETIVRQWIGHLDSQVIRQYTHLTDRDSHGAMQRLSQADDNKEGSKSESMRNDC